MCQRNESCKGTEAEGSFAPLWKPPTPVPPVLTAPAPTAPVPPAPAIWSHSHYTPAPVATAPPSQQVEGADTPEPPKPTLPRADNMAALEHVAAQDDDDGLDLEYAEPQINLEDPEDGTAPSPEPPAREHPDPTMLTLKGTAAMRAFWEAKKREHEEAERREHEEMMRTYDETKKREHEDMQ